MSTTTKITFVKAASRNWRELTRYDVSVHGVRIGAVVKVVGSGTPTWSAHGIRCNAGFPTRAAAVESLRSMAVSG